MCTHTSKTHLSWQRSGAKLVVTTQTTNFLSEKKNVITTIMFLLHVIIFNFRKRYSTLLQHSFSSKEYEFGF